MTEVVVNTGESIKNNAVNTGEFIKKNAKKTQYELSKINSKIGNRLNEIKYKANESLITNVNNTKKLYRSNKKKLGNLNETVKNKILGVDDDDNIGYNARRTMRNVNTGISSTAKSTVTGISTAAKSTVTGISTAAKSTGKTLTNVANVVNSTAKSTVTGISTAANIVGKKTGTVANEVLKSTIRAITKKSDKNIKNTAEKININYDEIIKIYILYVDNNNIKSIGNIELLKDIDYTEIKITNRLIKDIIKGITDPYIYIRYKNNDDEKVDIIYNGQTRTIDIKDINKIDSIIKETIPQNIKDAYKLLKTKKGGSKEKTPKSITKRKKKWINRKSYKYIK
jgi:hypothetical protein